MNCVVLVRIKTDYYIINCRTNKKATEVSGQQGLSKVCYIYPVSLRKISFLFGCGMQYVSFGQNVFCIKGKMAALFFIPFIYSH